MLLSVDTSFQTGGLALFKNKKLVFEASWDKEIAHSEILTVKFLDLLNESKIEAHEISEVICANGPGSFTGLRVGINFAKTIAYANKINLILSSSFRSLIDLEILKKHPTTDHLVLVNAYKNQVFRADYHYINDTLSEILYNHTIQPQDLSAEYSTFLIWGDGFDIYQNQIPETLKQKIIQPKLSKYNPAIRQAELYFNYDHCLKFLKIDPLSAEPLYLKKSEAEENLSSGVLKKHTQRKL